MANRGGGSRIGGFIRGVLVGLVVCGIAAVALSLSAPVPERGAVGGAPEAPVPSGAAVGPAAAPEPEATATEGAAEPESRAAAPAAGSAEPATAPAVDVTVVPPEGTADGTEPPPPAEEGAVAPQAIWQTGPATGGAGAPAAEEDDSFSVPAPPSQ